MTETPLGELFAEGTAPERDPEFARKVAAGVGRARLGRRIGAMAARGAGAAAAVATAGLIGPVVAALMSGAPQVMGAPLPAVVAVVVVGLALMVRRRVIASGAGGGWLEPME